MIELTNVCKRYDDTSTAVDNLSFSVQEGETFGLLGTSGCGKTTTIKMINRLVEPTSGSITIDGQTADQQPPEQLRRRLGYVIQNVGLFPHYTVEENIAITPKLLQWDPARIQKRSRELLDLVGLDAEQVAGRMPDALSGGQQRRVGLARALAADPPIILMDEPFGGLDPISKERIQKEFKKLLREIQKTTVLVTHDVFEAFDLCNRICLMDQGRAQQIGTPRALLFHPKNEFVRSFFDEHRLQLEMMTITVDDILKMTEKTKEDKPAGFDDGKIIHLDDTFFTVFEHTNANEERYRIANAAGEIIGSMQAGHLLEGFQTTRRGLKNE
ncbi:MAG TPA: ATP-binding cassette domain-containing protein [Balneolaceae bacterium]|nr:ATP-binding cassette domain-containing protein [Balneolaceae bacterium]